MSVIDEAIENLEDHGVDVERPETVRGHKRINSRSDLFSTFGVQDDLDVATYSHLSDRMDVYEPLAATGVINELEDEEFEQVCEAFDRNEDAFSSELREIHMVGVDGSFSDKVKLAKIHYLAAINDQEVDEELKQELRESFRTRIVFNFEHELVHASHYQKILEDDLESLHEDFRRYVRDVHNINQELDDYEERTMNEGISDLADVEMAAAMNFLGEGRLQNIVRIAGREHHRWKSEYDRNMEEIAKKKIELKKNITEDKDFEVWRAFNHISNLANPRMNDLNDVDGMDDAVEQMEDEEEEEYQKLVQAGITKNVLKQTLKQLRELEEERKQTHTQTRKYEDQVVDFLEDAIVREAELQGNFSEFIQQYADRMLKADELPRDFTEAYAQFWTAYKEGNLEGGREEIFASLELYDIDKIDETMEDLLDRYDELDGSQRQKVTHIMSSQMEYLDENYDIDVT